MQKRFLALTCRCPAPRSGKNLKKWSISSIPGSSLSISSIAWETLSPERYKILYARWISIRTSGERPFRLIPDDIDAVELGRVALDQHIGGNVFGDHAVRADHRHAADLGELVDAAQAADDHPIFDHHVAGDPGTVGNDDVAAHLDVVGHVDVRHDQVVVADPRLHRRHLRSPG